MMTMLHSAPTVETLRLLGAAEMARLLGIDTHALHMRIARSHDSVPPPDRKLDGCSIWFATTDLAAQLGVPVGKLAAESVGP